MKKSPQSSSLSPEARQPTPPSNPSPPAAGIEHRAPVCNLTKLGPGEEGAGQAPFPRLPSLGLRGGERGLQSQEEPPGGGAGREAGAGENPPGRHPEWLISADESLFSFRLNTLNRAPSDVYLHSLRANAGGGPRRRRGHTRAGGRREAPASSAGGLAVKAEMGGRVRVFPGPSPLGRSGPRPFVPTGGEERGAAPRVHSCVLAAGGTVTWGSWGTRPPPTRRPRGIL